MFDQGGFAGTVRTQHGNDIAAVDVKGHIMQHGAIGLVPESHILELDHGILCLSVRTAQL